MQLQYLIFDCTDEDSGRGSFDAMASVLPERRAALLGEISAVLGWAWGAFGPAGTLHDDGEWDFELQGVAEPGAPVQVEYEESMAEVRLIPEPAGPQRITLTLTLGGSRAFCDAFSDEFGLRD